LAGWNPDYSVNVAPLDDQHKMLFRLIDDLGESIRQGKSESLGTTVIELDNYTLYHFITEERLLESYGYPGLERHRKEHEKFAASVKEFKNKLAQDNSTLSMDILNYLQNWLKNHILVTDKKYSSYLNEKGLY